MTASENKRNNYFGDWCVVTQHDSIQSLSVILSISIFCPPLREYYCFKRGTMQIARVIYRVHFTRLKWGIYLWFNLLLLRKHCIHTTGLRQTHKETTFRRAVVIIASSSLVTQKYHFITSKIFSPDTSVPVARLRTGPLVGNHGRYIASLWQHKWTARIVMIGSFGQVRRPWLQAHGSIGTSHVTEWFSLSRWNLVIGLKEPVMTTAD